MPGRSLSRPSHLWVALCPDSAREFLCPMSVRRRRSRPLEGVVGLVFFSLILLRLNSYVCSPDPCSADHRATRPTRRSAAFPRARAAGPFLSRLCCGLKLAQGQRSSGHGGRAEGGRSFSRDHRARSRCGRARPSSRSYHTSPIIKRSRRCHDVDGYLEREQAQSVFTQLKPATRSN